VTVTVYVPEVLTVIGGETAPVLHKYVPPPEAVSFTLPGAQKVVAPDGVMVAVGFALTVTTLLAAAVQPAAFVTVTVYVPDALAVMAAVVADPPVAFH